MGTTVEHTEGDTVGPPETVPAPRRKGGYGQMRARILAVLKEHPEGLTAEQIRVFVDATRPLGDTLQGMKRQKKVTTEGEKSHMRYFS